jgi:integrase
MPRYHRHPGRKRQKDDAILFSRRLALFFVNHSKQERAEGCKVLLPQRFPKKRGMKMKLDAKTVAGLKLPDGKDEEINWDEDLSGFGLRLRRARGGNRVNRTWVAQYRAHGRTRRVTIGSVEKLSAPEARKEARKILAKVELGGDPQGDKATERLQAARTLRSVVDAYLKTKEPELRSSSLRVTKLYLTGPYFKPLHHTSINEIAHPDVAARLTVIKRTNGSVTAKQARSALSSVFKWAMGEGFMGKFPANPVVGTHVPAGPQSRDRVLTDTELAAIWRACKDDDYGRVVRLIILLGSRRQEVGGMRWSELNLADATWLLPSERSKNGHSHLLALPPPALSIIETVPQTGRDHLFGERADGFTKWSRSKGEIDTRLGKAVQPWRLHDTRRTCATRMADLGIQPHVIEAALNHFGGHRAGVAGVYNKSGYDREVRTALTVWSEHVLTVVEGRAAKIVPLIEKRA